MEFSFKNKSLKTNVQLFWKLGEKNYQKSKDFVSFPQKWNFFGLSRTNLFWFCQSLQCRFFIWKNEFENKRPILLNVVGENAQKMRKFCRFSPKLDFFGLGDLRKKFLLFDKAQNIHLKLSIPKLYRCIRRLLDVKKPQNLRNFGSFYEVCDISWLPGK